MTPQEFEASLRTEECTVYSMGIFYMSVCALIEPAKIAERLNAYPPGEGPLWRLADEDFHDGAQNGCPCHDKPGTHKHYLFSC